MASTSNFKAKKPRIETGVQNFQTSEVFDTDWDIDYYRTEHESEEHWALRRRFMETHKHKFPEDRLVCLAQLFTNMEFMGCKYPAETMHLVAELSKDLAKDFRASRATKLQRTFVTASDAAEQRAKVRRPTQQQQQGQRGDQEQSNNMNRGGAKRKCFGTGEWGDQPPNKQKSLRGDVFANLPYGNFVLSLTGGRNCLRASAQRCKVSLEENEIRSSGEQKGVEVYLNNKLVTTANADTLKAAKAIAFNQALEIFQRECYSIKLNPLRDQIKVNKTNNQVVCGVSKQQTDGLEDKKLDANNKGYKMMKMMGWTGGGLGSKTQGREDPVSYLLKTNRAGLGNQVSKLDRSYFTEILQNYVKSEDVRELQFESGFTKEERAMLHEIALRFNLKSRSHGKDDKRQLIIEKAISNESILTQVLCEANPIYLNKYSVQVPVSKAKIYPNHTAKLELDNHSN